MCIICIPSDSFSSTVQLLQSFLFPGAYRTGGEHLRLVFTASGILYKYVSRIEFLSVHYFLHYHYDYCLHLILLLFIIIIIKCCSYSWNLTFPSCKIDCLFISPISSPDDVKLGQARWSCRHSVN